jgi:folate-dependent phosphoribosylglycinamide formyltransferase PurN
MNVTVLTNKGSLYGKKIILALRRSGIAVSVVVVHQPLSYKVKLFRSVARRVGLLDALKLSWKHIMDGYKEDTKVQKENPELLKDYPQLCKNVAISKGTNFADTELALKKFETNLLVLGQAGIVRQNILQIPKIGVLNGHPGILPFYRGIDCPHWALLKGDYDKIGASVHWVDKGIDTGRIIATQKFAVKGIKEISIVEERVYDLCSEMIADVVVEISNGKHWEGIPQIANEGQQYYKMSCKDLSTLKITLQSFYFQPIF